MQTYAITDGLSIKIGKSENVDARINQLQTGNPRYLMLLGCVDGDIERQVHDILQQRGVRRFAGEWFEDCERARSVLTELDFRARWSHPRLETKFPNGNAEAVEDAYRDGINEGFGRGIRHALEAYSDEIESGKAALDAADSCAVEEHW